jgi:hypothetical protein
VPDPELSGLPTCDDFGASDVAGGQVLATTHDDLYAVSVSGQLVCVDDGTGVTEMQRRGVDSATYVPPLEGTPLPARTGPAPSISDDQKVLQGTPLPANH